MRQVKLSDTKQLFWIHVGILHFFYSSSALPMTHPPIVPDHHFMFMWNAPSELCKFYHNISLDLSYFSLVSSTLKHATDQSISIFYIDRFGIFPYINEQTGEMYHDGLPQSVNLDKHQKKAKYDIEYYIPFNQTGLAVLDFEKWRPLWERNWGSKSIYRNISIEKVKESNDSLSDKEAKIQAEALFDQAAKTYFIQSIRLGKNMRPNRLWGFYLFPDCYNYNYKNDMINFTGRCPGIEELRNDKLEWLWSESTALFPSIYLEVMLKDSNQSRWYVRHRIQEAMRVSTQQNNSYSIPIFAYVRPVYKDTVDEYMSEFDLVNTIGEAAALGAAGVISWGGMSITKTSNACIDAQNHLKNIMNPYILNVTTAAKLCSQVVCQSKGRCVRKNWNSDVFLHLHPRRFKIRLSGSSLTVSGQLIQTDENYFKRNFNCMCYSEEPCQSEILLRSCCSLRMNSLSLLIIVVSVKYLFVSNS